MAYDESTADRIALLLKGKKAFEEKKMFGGIGWLLNGNMCVGIWKEFLIVRVGPDDYADLLARAHVKEFDITGRAMSGWVMVQPAGFATDPALKEWIALAIAYVGALPRKAAARQVVKKKTSKKK